MFGYVLAFHLFYVLFFNAKPGATNNHRNESSDISSSIPFSRDLDNIFKNSKSFPSVDQF